MGAVRITRRGSAARTWSRRAPRSTTQRAARFRSRGSRLVRSVLCRRRTRRRPIARAVGAGGAARAHWCRRVHAPVLTVLRARPAAVASVLTHDGLHTAWLRSVFASGVRGSRQRRRTTVADVSLRLARGLRRAVYVPRRRHAVHLGALLVPKGSEAILVAEHVALHVGIHRRKDALRVVFRVDTKCPIRQPRKGTHIALSVRQSRLDTGRDLVGAAQDGVRVPPPQREKQVLHCLCLEACRL
mmetsp:Transcript_5183/g.18616  ORF Transcript_5183/g.18616 Transcript_5183/m.18616 type:complete len:243 (+) Transcript_5183:1966-2694(+)